MAGGIARIAQIALVAVLGFAVTGCVQHDRGPRNYYSEKAKPERKVDRSASSKAYDGRKRYDDDRGDRSSEGRDRRSYAKQDYDRRDRKRDARERYDDRDDYDGDDRAYRDRGYGPAGSGGYKVCDSDGDRCYGSSEPRWDYREYYRRQGYRWQDE